MINNTRIHDDVIKWKHFPRYWPFVRGIHRSPMTSQHKGQWRGALMFSLIGTRINGWVNNGVAGDLRRYRAHYDVTVIQEVIRKFHKYSRLLLSRDSNSFYERQQFILHWDAIGDNHHKELASAGWRKLWLHQINRKRGLLWQFSC